MCGLVGWFKYHASAESPSETLHRRQMIQYRGPDDCGIFTDEHIELAHVRLSILDLSPLGAQPMHSKSGRFVIAYNGEVYNFREMAKKLIAAGQVLKSTGDTEVILQYMETFGVDECLKEAEGMFAFALWDRQEKRLMLSRDRYGIKPLYYRVDGNGVRFGSEIKTVSDKRAEPNHTSVNAAMLGLGCAYDANTLFKNVHSVRAGEVITLDLSRKIEKRFFFRLPDFVDPAYAQELDKMSAEDAAELVFRQLRNSVNLCLISDAPIAVLASGGVDSSVISGMANEGHPNLKLFHADVVGASETDAASALARHLKCELFSARVTMEDTLQHTATVTHHYEMPLMYHSNAVPFYLVSRLAAQQGVKVVLTGEGSDEHFIGYPAMVLWPLIQKYRRALARVQDLVHSVPKVGKILWPRVNDNLALQLRSTVFRYELDERRSEAGEVYSFIKNPNNRLLNLMSLDMCEGNIPPLLHRNDRLGMAWGIESRFPFLGHSVARVALNLPPKFKVRRTLAGRDWRHPFLVDKWCIRKAAERYMPLGLAFRGKYAFRAVVYQRMKIDEAFFRDGFVTDFYGLDRKSVALMLKNASVDWQSRLFLLDVWGRIFCGAESCDSVSDHIHKHVTITA